MQPTALPPTDDPGAHPELKLRLREAMRGLASSVTVITAGDAGGNRYAMTATSISALSMAPPSLVICVNRGSSIYAALEGNADFCTNFLTEKHERLARACSNSAERDGRFLEGDFATDENGVPYLADAQASIICAQDGRHLYGTHAILIGRVKTIRANGPIAPLLYVDGQYRSIAPASAAS